MFKRYKKLIFFGLQTSFVSINTITALPTVKLSSLIKNNLITEEEKDTFIKVEHLLINFKNEVDSGLEVLNESKKNKNLVLQIIQSTGKLKNNGIILKSNDLEFMTYSRQNGNNGIKIQNNEHIISDEEGLLGKLNFSGYTIEEALLEVNDILDAIDEAKLFNISKLDSILSKFSAAFRLKHAISIKDELA